jgi:uroporphyrin-III C-methyltransferase
MENIPIRFPAFEPGWVWLVGAGPGDPGLLTLHALEGLRRADVIVYDALVNSAVLELAGPGATLEYAGKRGGRPSPQQPDISRRLVRLAGERKKVLRLKGGDPFVFGRGGEEATALVEAGVPFRVVPGITAALAGLAYAGIPATHRDTNSVITFLTGHNTAGVVPDTIDWKAVATGSPVIVMYMALKHLAPIRERLLAAGRRPEEAMAVVSQATVPTQRVLETSLGTCVADTAEAAIDPPAIVVLGEVVRMRQLLLSLTGAVSTPASVVPGNPESTGAPG